jgi:REP element-mobilizing transposase RayT
MRTYSLLFTPTWAKSQNVSTVHRFALVGVEDHVHILARFGRAITQAEWVKELKRVSNGWLKREGGLRHFQWQSGYADFSVSASNLETVKRYIEGQKDIISGWDFRMKSEDS